MAGVVILPLLLPLLLLLLLSWAAGLSVACWFGSCTPVPRGDNFFIQGLGVLLSDPLLWARSCTSGGALASGACDDALWAKLPRVLMLL